MRLWTVPSLHAGAVHLPWDPGAPGSWNKWLQGPGGREEPGLLVLVAQCSMKKQHRHNWVTNNHGY